MVLYILGYMHAITTVHFIKSTTCNNIWPESFKELEYLMPNPYDELDNPFQPIINYMLCPGNKIATCMATQFNNVLGALESRNHPLISNGCVRALHFATKRIELRAMNYLASENIPAYVPTPQTQRIDKVFIHEFPELFAAQVRSQKLC